MTMPKKTKKQKIIAAYRNRLHQLQATQTDIKISNVNNNTIKPELKILPKVNVKTISPVEMITDKITTKYFFSDLKKSLIIIVLIIALEFVLYFATINNYLSRLIKF